MPDYSQSFNQERSLERKKARKISARKTAGSPPSDLSGVEFIVFGSIAFLNDACDWIGLDLLLFRALDLATSFILGSWCWLRLKRFPTTRFASTFAIEIIPLVGDVSPAWTIFVISLYLEQRKNHNAK